MTLLLLRLTVLTTLLLRRLTVLALLGLLSVSRRSAGRGSVAASGCFGNGSARIGEKV